MGFAVLLRLVNLFLADSERDNGNRGCHWMDELGIVAFDTTQTREIF